MSFGGRVKYVNNRMSRSVKYYGWRPDVPDHRDFHYGAVLHAAEEQLPIPDQIDLRPLMPPVQDQGEIGSCTAHATVAVWSTI
jgi:C1A family cysteine protease